MRINILIEKKQVPTVREKIVFLKSDLEILHLIKIFLIILFFISKKVKNELGKNIIIKIRASFLR